MFTKAFLTGSIALLVGALLRQEVFTGSFGQFYYRKSEATGWKSSLWKGVMDGQEMPLSKYLEKYRENRRLSALFRILIPKDAHYRPMVDATNIL